MLARALVAVLALGALVAGCGGSSRSSSAPAGVAPVASSFVVGPLLIQVRYPISAAEAARFGRAAREHLVFVQAQGRPVPSIVVNVVRTMPVVQGCPSTSFGCAENGPRRVWVLPDAHGYPVDSLTGLFHELLHVTHQLDQHTDPRWAAWDRDGYAMVARL